MRFPAARLLPAAAIILVPLRAPAVEVEPRDGYVITHSLLGAAGGAALGAAIGGLSRPDNTSLVKPFLRWGAWGAAFGAVAGAEVGLTTVGQPSDVPGLPPPPSREAGACLGALAGEMVGLGAGSLAANGASRKSDSVWSGVALGAILGAGIGYLLPPRAVIRIPAPVSESRKSLIREQTGFVPLVPVTPEAARTMADADAGAYRGEQLGPPGSSLAAGDVNASISTPADRRLLPPTVPSEPPPRAMILPSPAPDPDPTGMGGSVQVLAMLEGLMLGGAVGAAMPGENGKLWSRAGIGAGTGMMGGLSAGSAMVRSWEGRDGYQDSGENLRQSGSTVSTVAGGLLGGILGIATGAALHNAVDGFDNQDVARCAVAGNITGLLAGYLLAPEVR